MKSLRVPQKNREKNTTQFSVALNTNHIGIVNTIYLKTIHTLLFEHDCYS